MSISSLTRFANAGVARVLPRVPREFFGMVTSCFSPCGWKRVSRYRPRIISSFLGVSVVSILSSRFFSVHHAHIRTRYGATEINLGVGLNTLASEESFENSFLSVFEEEFNADVSWCIVE